MANQRREWTANQSLEPERTAPLSALDASDAHTIAEAIVNRALDWASTRLNADVSAVVTRLNRGDTAAQREFKLGLARHVAEYLGFLDKGVKAVYVADHVNPRRSELDAVAPRWTVHLVVFAEPKTAALKSLLSALNDAFAMVLREYLNCARMERFLDVQLVNRADLENLARCAALLTAPRC